MSTVSESQRSNLLAKGALMELGPEIKVRLSQIAERFANFTGHVGNTRQPEQDQSKNRKATI